MGNQVNILEEVQNNFLVSSLDTNINRAFPDARDGLKPGQRACLYEMYHKGFSNNKPHVKSAKVSGAVIGELWPHSDVAVYETFARMSQPFVNNNPEIDFHGANGNLIVGSDGVANQRYTEVRLSKIAEDGLLWSLNKDVVDFQLNFSEDMEWPKVLPSLFPRLLVNGAIGIGVGIANTWVTHNLGDVVDGIVKYIKTNEVDNSLKPDFPTGGIIINSDDLDIINKTGKGKIILRGKTFIKGNEIHITELPYQVYVKPFIEDIIKKIQDGKLLNISDVSDRSDIKQLKIVVECTSAAITKNVLQSLYENTDLQVQINANQVAIINNTPKLLTLTEMYDIIVKHNISVLQRAAQFDINKLEEELYKLKTIKAAIDDINTVVYILKDVNNTKEQTKLFKEKFNFCTAQIDMVSKMRLNTLMKTNRDKLVADIKEKTERVEYLQKYLNSEDMQKQDLIDKMTSIKNKYNTPKRTEYDNIETVGKAKEKKRAVKTIVKTAVSLDNKGYLKACPAIGFRKTKNIASSVILDSNQIVYLFSSFGKLYRIKADTIKQTPKGTPIVNVINAAQDEKILFMTTDATSLKNNLTILTNYGIIKKINFKEGCYSKVQNKKGLIYIKLAEGDNVVFVDEEHKNAQFVVGNKKHILSFNIADVSTMGRAAAGRKSMKEREPLVIYGYLTDMPQNIKSKVKIGSIGGTGQKWSPNE